MITESESSSSPPTAEATNDAAAAQHAEPHKASGGTERSEDVATSSLNSANDTSSLGVRKTSITSPDPTAYVAKARITRPTPPPPPYNPMQFVQIKPCNLYQTAQQQLKKAEEVKKIKEIKKEEPEDWQNNLDNWKSSRRKRVEHIIDRVVEVKKLEYEEYDRSRRKSKTFSEMIEERGERGVRVGRAKLASLAVYNEDESNDLSDLGIGTSSTSGKSSLSEEYDNNSVMSDNNDLEKANGLAANHLGTSIAREYVSSPGYDTSSSTAPASSPDPCEYTYESAIQDYKQRVSRAKLGSVTSLQRQTKTTSKESTPENDDSTPLNNYSARRGSKIEERLIGFEVNSPNDNIESSEKTIVDLPKINISKRKEIFENAVSNNSSYQLPTGSSEPKRQDGSDVSKVPLREHIKVDETFTPKTKVEVKRLSGDMTSVKDRLLSLEQQQQLANSVNGDARALQSRAIDISVPPLKERLTSLQNAASKDELKKPPVVLVDARQLEIMKDEEEHARQRKKQMDVAKSLESKALIMESETEDTADEMAVESRGSEIDRDDSGIQTADDIEEEQRGHVVLQLLSRTQEEKLDEAIAALAVEERQLEQATAVINKIEAESTQLSNVINAEDAASPNTISPTASDELPRQMEFSINEALELAPEVNDRETAAHQTARTTPSNNQTKTDSMAESQHRIEEERAAATPGLEQRGQNEPIYENISTTAAGQVDTEAKFTPVHSKTSYPNLNNGFAISNESSSVESHVFLAPSMQATAADEPYYQVPKSCEPYYDAPKHLRPIPVYENIEVFYSGVESSSLTADNTTAALKMEPPKEKPPPPPTESPPAFHACDSLDNGDNWSSDNTYETIATRLSNGTAAAPGGDPHPSPPIKRLNSTKRIKKELRHKRSSFLGIEGSIDDDLENYLELTVAPPPDMAQLLQEERRLEKQLYMKAGLCDSSDTGESRDSGVSENHSRQSSEPFTNSSEEVDCGDELPLSLITDTGIKPSKVVYQREAHLRASQTPLLQTVRGNSAESWTESATVAAAATKSLTEATATANAKMQSIEEKIREQEEVLRVERELLHLEQEELKRQRENLLLRENLARRELQHGAKMLMSANRCSLQDLPAAAVPSSTGFHPAQMEPVQQRLNPQQIYANVPTPQQQHYLVDTDYRKSMSDLNELSKRLMLSTPLETTMAPTKPMRALQVPTTNGHDDFARQHPSPNPLRASAPLIKIAAVHSNQPAPPVHQSTQNCAVFGSNHPHNGHPHANMTRNTLHALSATPRPKYTDGWVQVQSRKSVDSSLSRDPAWLASYRQKRKSVPDAYHFGSSGDLTSFPENGQRRLAACSASASYPGPSTTSSNGKPLPDSVIQTLTERLQSKGIGERKRFENYAQKSAMQATAFSKHQGYHANSQQHYQPLLPSHTAQRPPIETVASNHATVPTAPAQDKVLSVSGKKRCSHCGDELGRGAAMIIESLLLFYHINCFKCCVCHVQLGDGLNGTDVRVRNHKLHCQNCYSSDDGIKFSCV